MGNSNRSCPFLKQTEIQIEIFRRFIVVEKIKIEKNTVQETLIIPLYGRKMCSEKFSALYTDIYAKKLCDRLDYDFSELEKKNNSFLYEFGALEAAMRQLDIIWEIKEYLKIYPKATIVNLGCGLDETGKACDNGSCSIVNVRFPRCHKCSKPTDIKS